MADEDFYFEYVLEKRPIPPGYAKCPMCGGRGEIRLYYGGPLDKGQFRVCHLCGGRKIMKKEDAEEWKKILSRGKYGEDP